MWRYSRLLQWGKGVRCFFIFFNVVVSMVWLIKIVSTRLVGSLSYGFLCHHSFLLVRWPTKRNGRKHPPTWIISGNCIGYRAFRTNTRRNSTLSHQKPIKLFLYLILPRKHRCFRIFLFFCFSSVHVLLCHGERERKRICVICCYCYHLCFLLGWLDVFSTVLLQVLLFMITLWPNQVSNPLSLSVFMYLVVVQLFFCFHMMFWGFNVLLGESEWSRWIHIRDMQYLINVNH